MTTRGDRVLDRPLAKIGGKGLFVKELEAALEDGRADIAVHSAKDVPMELPSGFCLAAIPAREDPRDCLVSNRAATLASLPDGSIVGTSSLRREAQLRERQPGLVVEPLRGNLETRLAKLDRGEYHAIVLAAAGLKRLGLGGRIRALIEPEQSLPAPGQGALAIECREARSDVREWLAILGDADASACVRAERAVSRALSGRLPAAAGRLRRGERQRDPPARPGGDPRRKRGGACRTERTGGGAGGARRSPCGGTASPGRRRHSRSHGMNPAPLSGRGIVITRPREHAQALAAVIQAAGGEPVFFPTIEIVSLPRPEVLDRLDAFDLAIFVSPTAVAQGLESTGRAWPGALKIAAVGAGTAMALERHGFAAVIAPVGGADSEALAALPELQDLRGRSVLIFRGEGGREWLRETLRARGARVDYAECYRRVRPDIDTGPLLARWQRGSVDAVSITSAEGLSNLFGMLGPAGQGYVCATPVFVPHPRIGAAAEALGVRQVVVTGRGDETLRHGNDRFFCYSVISHRGSPLHRGRQPLTRFRPHSRAPLPALVRHARRNRGCRAGAASWAGSGTTAAARLNALREEVARQVRDSEADSRDARLSVRQTQEALREAQAKLAQLELRLAESQERQVALDALYQDLSRNRDEWVLAEVEQMLTIASQQLQLAGSARAALLALQAADARLARSPRPQFLPLRKVFARDIERLRAAPGADLAEISSRLDQLAAGVDALPLAQDARPRTAADSGALQAQEGFWAHLADELLAELKQLVRIQNLERSEPVLLHPTQVFFLRENLKLRLLNARLALVSRDETVFRSDVKTAKDWLERYFDTRARTTAAAIATLGRFSAGNLVLPSIAESLAAVRTTQVPVQRRER